MSLQYIFLILLHAGMHQSEVYKLWIVTVVEAGSNIVYVAMTQVYSRAVMQQSTRYYFHFAFLHQFLHFNHYDRNSILFTSPIT